MLSAAAAGLNRHQNPPSRSTSGITVRWTGGNTRRILRAGITAVDALESIANAIRSLLEDIRKHERDVERAWLFKVVVREDNSRGELALSRVLHVQVWPASSSERVRLPAFDDTSRAYPIKAPTDRHPDAIHASVWTELAQPVLDGRSDSAPTSVAFRWHWFESNEHPSRTPQQEKQRLFQDYEKGVVLVPASDSQFTPSADSIMVTFFSSEPN
ncbi:hypothetical protein JCM9279_000592 [Rhodotorula babjevae]